MKTLLVILIILQLAVLWFFILKDNVTISFRHPQDFVQPPVDLSLPDEKKEVDEPENGIVPKSVIRLEDLQNTVEKLVDDRLAERLNEKDVEFDDSKSKFKAVKDVDKAFEDNRTDTLADGQSAAAPEDDEAVPDFETLNNSLKVISDKNATSEQKAHAMNVAVSIEDSNIIVALPEPLHSQLMNSIAEYNASAIDSDSEDSETDKPLKDKETDVKRKLTLRSKSPQKLPDDIKDFNPANY